MDENCKEEVAVNLAAGTLAEFQPPLAKSRDHIRELIGKQNKLCIEISKARHDLNNVKYSSMMDNVRVYGAKLKLIKKRMDTIRERSKMLKKRAINLQALNHKSLEVARQEKNRLSETARETQLREQSLIGSTQAQKPPSTKTSTSTTTNQS